MMLCVFFLENFESDRLEEKPEPRFVKPMSFIELDRDSIELQIGLLRQVYRTRIESKEFGLRDDEKVMGRVPKVIRPKVPPSGKIPIKRRIVGGGGGGVGGGLVKKKKVEEEDEVGGEGGRQVNGLLGGSTLATVPEVKIDEVG